MQNLFLRLLVVVAVCSSASVEEYAERYIVTLHQDTTPEAMALHLTHVRASISASFEGVTAVFESLNMYSLNASEEDVKRIQLRSEVQEILRNERLDLKLEQLLSDEPRLDLQKRTTDAQEQFSWPRQSWLSRDNVTRLILRLSLSLRNMITQSPSPWGLARISHKKRTRRNQYVYNAHNISTPVIYFFDTGIQVQHQQFEGRVTAGPIFALDPLKGPGDDTYGHGTRIAGIALGKTVGVARTALGVSIRVIPRMSIDWKSTSSPYTSAEQLIAAVNYVLDRPGPQSLKVINLSIGLKSHFSITAAMTRASLKGVHIVGSAGNNGVDVLRLSETNPAMHAGYAIIGGCDR